MTDFGLSRALGVDSDYYTAAQEGRWPFKWLAPESNFHRKFSHASDVWSYAITLWEMFSFGIEPYEELEADETIEFVHSGQRLSKPEKCPDQVYEKMLECWSPKPECRPKFKDLDAFFQGLVHA
ncbi:tyrosine-protein kinase ZAP-70-like [Gigantopelta aegis]|uniref:tyrosine-protein kinase ZAP-70-like n=1 Tax=Gigantopelta aegis TaxID=1735272 RepID=UPI001B88DB75|nr:tyrosine-protein kinase ZAP-70-like [Gigantopelta aegis]